MTLHRFTRATLLSLALVVAACSNPQTVVERQQRDSLPYEVVVLPMGAAEVSRDGFDARFAFEVISSYDLQRNSLVQELHQTVTLEYEDGRRATRELSLVEAFRLRFSHLDGDQRLHYRIPYGQSDRHTMHGLDRLPPDVVAVRIDRSVFAYVADVHGADFTPDGFAHLPRNEDGNVVSRIPDRFNESYQRAHDTRGWVYNSGDSLGIIYRIRYRLVRTGDRDIQFRVDHGGGHGTVERPWVMRRR